MEKAKGDQIGRSVTIWATFWHKTGSLLEQQAFLLGPKLSNLTKVVEAHSHELKCLRIAILQLLMREAVCVGLRALDEPIQLYPLPRINSL